MTRVYFASTVALNDDELFSRCCEVLSQERISKAEKMRFRKDKNLSIGAGLLIRKCLQEYGLEEKNMVYRTGKKGKPYFACAPEICFSVSHSGEMVMAAFSDVDVGCDVERIAPVNLSIAERHFCRSEYESIMAMPTDEKRMQQFFRYWTLKESFMKATGLGFSLNPDAFEMMLLPEEISVMQSVNNEYYSFREFTPAEEYQGALCVRSDHCDTVSIFLTPEECLA